MSKTIRLASAPKSNKCILTIAIVSSLVECSRLLSSITQLELKGFYDFVENFPVLLARLTRLTHLTFDSEFNQRVDNLPQPIAHITFGRNFNRSVDSLPSSVVYLQFGLNFNPIS